VSHVFHELVHVFTHADKGIFAMARDITYKAGIIALDFVEGRRKRHFNLFQYLLIILGIATFLISKTDFMEKAVDAINKSSATPLSAPALEVQGTIMTFLRKYYNLVQFITIPILAFFSWLFIRKNKYNYAENIVLHSAITAQLNTFSAVFTTLLILIPGINETAYSIFFGLVTLTAFAAGIHQFYKMNWAKSALYSILVYFCAYLVQIMTIAVIVVFMLIRHKMADS